MPLHFNMQLMQFLADHRAPWLTDIFLFFTFIGDINGYILVATLIYVAFDKRLAVRLSVIVLLSMSLNHILKMIIKNPRPFIREGTYMQKWAVSANNARELATEYSTPSGHAMACSAFYAYLYAAVKSRLLRVACVVLILLVGLSRPYLGVHYLEDVLSGWVAGLAIALIAVFYGDRINAAWDRFSLGSQIAFAVAASAALWLYTVAINGWHIDSQPRAFLAYAGALTGIFIARRLELHFVDFDPLSSSVAVKLLRFVLTVAASILTLQLLGAGFAKLAGNFTLPGYGLEYVRYATGSVVNLFLAPLIFTKLGLAKSLRR
jgi:membrane-associated phospholipid phosphatase